MAKTAWPKPNRRKNIGVRISRIDGPPKVTGAAKYAYDMNLDNMLYAKMVQSSKAIASLTEVDISAAEKMPRIVAIIVELLTRRRVALAIAPIIGFTGLVIARLFEYGDASDPNDPLLAVLRSNFWLTTHVLTITFGYAAGFVTAAFGLVYMFMRILKLDGGDKSVRRFLTRMTYGCV
mgnify:CR=1 FL=1